MGEGGGGQNHVLVDKRATAKQSGMMQATLNDSLFSEGRQRL